MPATQASTTSTTNGQHDTLYIYLTLGPLMVVVCAVAAKLASQRDRRRQQARGAVAQSQQPCSDGKRPECHEIWLSPASSDSQWQSMLPISAETILCTPSAASRDKSPGRWSLVKDLHPNRHSPMHQNSPYPSTTSLQPYVSQNHHRPCEEPARRDRWMDDTHSSVLQVAVLLAMPAPHPPLSGTTPASMCADAERLPHGGVVPDMCLGVAHIPFKSEADTTQSNNPSYSIPLPSPTSARVQQSLFPSVALVRLTHPIF